MKKIPTLYIFMMLTIVSNAQLTVNVPTAGELSTTLSSAGADPDTITNLIVTGAIDARDIFFLRDNMPLLSEIDLEVVQIQVYGDYPVNEMPDSSFYLKTSLTQIVFPNSITSIGDRAFFCCFYLTGNLDLPSSLTSIGVWAFTDCMRLTGSLILPNSITSIGECAFSGCSGFTGTLTLPESLTSIEYGTFRSCEGLSGDLIIPNSVTSIGGVAFYDCSGFNGTLSIPNSVTSIGRYAFMRCIGLTGSLTIPNSVISIEERAFSSCESFTGQLVLPESIASIGNNAFSSCSGITGEIDIPNSIVSFGEGVFAGCKNVTAFNVAEDNTFLSVNDGVLLNKTATAILQFPAGKVTDSYIFPQTVTSVGNYAFYRCDSLKGALNLTDSITAIGGYAFFKSTGLTSVHIPNSLTYIGDRAFYECTGLTGDLNIPISVSYIGTSAFYNCSGLTGKLSLPKSISAINPFSFSGCSGFTELYLPSSLIVISKNSFENCTSLQKVIVAKIKPVSISASTFNGVDTTTCELVVPIDSKTAYQEKDYWKAFQNISESIFVIFDSQGGSLIADTIVYGGAYINPPISPTKTDDVFLGWYKEDTCTNAWDFETDIVTANVTLYALWESMIDTSDNPISAVHTTEDVHIIISPNPTTDYLKVKGEKLKSIIIFNMSGSKKIQLLVDNNDEAIIDVSFLRKGIYLVNIETSDGVTTNIKLIKN